MSYRTTNLRQPLTGLTIELDFNAVDPLEVARSLSQITGVSHKCLLISCDNLACLRRYGVCFFVSQLLLMRTYGITILLRRVRPELGRALRILHLDTIFRILAE